MKNGPQNIPTGKETRVKEEKKRTRNAAIKGGLTVGGILGALYGGSTIYKQNQELNLIREENADLEEQRANLSLSSLALTQENESLNAEKTDLARDKAALEAEKTDLAREKAALEAEKADLERDKAALEDKNAEVTQTGKALQDANAELQSRYETVQAENTTLRAEKSDLEKSNAVLESRNETATAEYKELKDSNAELQSRYETVQAENTTLRAEKSNLEKSNAVLENQNETVTAAYTKLQSQNETLQAKNATLEAEKTDLVRDNAALENQATALKMETATATDANKALQETNKELTGQNATLEAENKSLRAQTATLETQLATAKENSQQTQEEKVVAKEDTKKEESSETKTNTSEKEAPVEMTYERALYESLKKETVKKEDVPRLIDEFCTKYKLKEGSVEYKFLHTSSVVKHLQEFNNTFQLNNQMAVYAFSRSFIDLTYNFDNPGNGNFQLPEDNGLRLVLHPEDVITQRILVNQLNESDMLRIQGNDAKTSYDREFSLQRGLEVLQVFYLNTHKELPLQLLFDNPKSQECKNLCQLQKMIVDINIKRDKNQLTSDDTDDFILFVADLFVNKANENINPYVKFIAAQMVDSFARINGRMSKGAAPGEALVSHKDSGVFKKYAINLLYLEEYDEKNNPELYVVDGEAAINPDQTYSVLRAALLDIITRSSGNRKETAERCVEMQQAMINEIQGAQKLAITLSNTADLSTYIVDGETVMGKTIKNLGLKNAIKKANDLATLTNNRLKAAVDKVFTLAKGAVAYFKNVVSPKKSGGTKKKTEEKKEVKEIKPDEMTKKEKKESKKQKKKIEKEIEKDNEKAKKDQEKAEKEIEERIKKAKDEKEIEQIKKDAKKHGISEEWVDAKKEQQEGEQKKKQQEKENKKKQEQQKKEAEERKKQQEKENDDQVNRDNDLLTESEKQANPTNKPKPTNTQKPVNDGSSFYDDNPDGVIDHFSDPDGDPYGDVVGNSEEQQLRDKIERVLGLNCEEISEEGIAFLRNAREFYNQVDELNNPQTTVATPKTMIKTNISA